MVRVRLKISMILIATMILPTAVRANYLLTLTLSPNDYIVTAGSPITLAGFFVTTGTLDFTYSEDDLFGLTPSSPHLGIVAGNVLSSANFSPPISGAYFEDIFGGGFLGPAMVSGPTTTSISFLRTFVIPAGTPQSFYDYSYGVEFIPSTSESGTILFDRSLVVQVVPEASSLVLVVGTLLLLAFRNYQGLS